MKGELIVPLYDHDDEVCGPISPKTDFKVQMNDMAITVSLPEDLKHRYEGEEDQPVYARTVVIEIGEGGLLKVHVYPFDKEEPVSVRVGLDGEYEVETP